MKTIADITYKYLLDNDHDFISYGDSYMMSDIANLCTHANLKDIHPLNRQDRILQALERDSKNRFEKTYYRAFRGLARSLKIIKTCETCKHDSGFQCYINARTEMYCGNFNLWEPRDEQNEVDGLL